MSKAKIHALAGHLGGLLLAWLLIHFLAADLLASMVGISEEVAYWSLTAVLLLWGGVTAVRILKGRDALTNKLETVYRDNGSKRRAD